MVVAGNGDRKAGEHRGDSRDIVALRTVRLGAAEHDVFDLGRIELRSFSQNVLNAVRGQVIGTRDVERSAERFGKTSPRAGDDYGLLSYGYGSG